MELFSRPLIDVLTYLMPGLIAAALVYSLTPTQRPSPFERIVQALIFTILIQAGVAVLKSLFIAVGRWVPTIGHWGPDVALIWSVLVAVGIGLAFAWAANTDMVHRLLRGLGLTFQTSYQSEWYGAFCQRPSYVVLHLKGERRLYGWPVEWPSNPGAGHFVITEGEWLDDGKTIPLTGVDRILVKAQDVEMVELMLPLTEEISDGRPQSTDTVAKADGTAEATTHSAASG